MDNNISLGDPTLFFPDDSETIPARRIRHFSRSVLSVEAWFRSADELIEAMQLLEPNVERFWQHSHSIFLGFDQTSGARSNQPQPSGVPPKHSLINQHMMLAGFAIENLCKGYLVGRLSRSEQRKVEEQGVLPKSLSGHDLQKLIGQVGMRVSEPEQDLLKRMADAVVWRGRYPSATTHEQIRPFPQMGSDIRNIKTLLRKLRRHVEAKNQNKLAVNS